MHWTRANTPNEFGEDVVGQPDVEIAFAMQDDTVADDVVDGVHQREEHGDEQRDEDVGRDVKGAGEIVTPLSE